jgi:chorismate synthase
VVVETMVALVVARAALEKFGGDSLAETRANVDNYLRGIADRGHSGGQERSDRGIDSGEQASG